MNFQKYTRLEILWSSFWKLMWKLFSFLWRWGQSIFMKQSSGPWKSFLIISVSTEIRATVVACAISLPTEGWWGWNSSSHILVQRWGETWFPPPISQNFSRWARSEFYHFFLLGTLGKLRHFVCSCIFQSLLCNYC